MLRTIGRIVGDAVGLRPPGRAVATRAGDVFVVSYPKSGNTWVRFLIANLIGGGRPVDFVSVHEIVPDPYRTSARRLARLPDPRVLKSHEYFDPRYPRVVYLVRDPRDIVVSYYHQHHRRRLIAEDEGLDRFVERFLAGELDPYGSWQEHVGSWLGAREGDPRFLLLRYEDLSLAPAAGLRRIAEFIGRSASESALEEACRSSSFQRMRELERDQVEARVLPAARRSHPFARRGTPGGWRDELPPPAVAQIVQRWGRTMTALGYADEAGRASIA